MTPCCSWCTDESADNFVIATFVLTAHETGLVAYACDEHLGDGVKAALRYHGAGHVRVEAVQP